MFDKQRRLAVAFWGKLLVGLVVQEAEARHEELGDSKPLESFQSLGSILEQWRVFVDNAVSRGDWALFDLCAILGGDDSPKVVAETPPRLSTGQCVGLGIVDGNDEDSICAMVRIIAIAITIVVFGIADISIGKNLSLVNLEPCFESLQPIGIALDIAA